jgi:hypothetical protein
LTKSLPVRWQTKRPLSATEERAESTLTDERRMQEIRI